MDGKKFSTFTGVVGMALVTSGGNKKDIGRAVKSLRRDYLIIENS